MAWQSGEPVRKNKKRFFHGRAIEDYPGKSNAQATDSLLYSLDYLSMYISNRSEKSEKASLLPHDSMRALCVTVSSCLLAQGLVDMSNIGAVLKDRYYKFEMIFLLFCVLILLFLRWLSRKTDTVLFVVRLGLACVGGYVSGLSAFVFLPLFSSHGWQRFATLPRNSGELVGLLLSPLLTLSWLVALLAWLVAWVVWRKWSNSFAGICVSMTALGLLLLCHRFSLVGHFIWPIK